MGTDEHILLLELVASGHGHFTLPWTLISFYYTVTPSSSLSFHLRFRFTFGSLSIGLTIELHNWAAFFNRFHLCLQDGDTTVTTVHGPSTSTHAIQLEFQRSTHAVALYYSWDLMLVRRCFGSDRGLPGWGDLATRV